MGHDPPHGHPAYVQSGYDCSQTHDYTGGKEIFVPCLWKKEHYVSFMKVLPFNIKVQFNTPPS
jgi:hypothetical protein